MDTITAKGQQGTVSFDGATITIRRPWFAAQSAGTTKHIPLSSVQAVKYRRPGWFSGMLAFTLPGSRQEHPTRPLSVQARRDENAVVIPAMNTKQAVKFEALYQAIMQAKGFSTAEADTPAQ